MGTKIGITGLEVNKVIEELKGKGIDVVVVNSEHLEKQDSFMLNGVRYIKKENSKFGMPYSFDYGESKYKRELPKEIDIIREYGFIQNKESKLSKWERDTVVTMFESKYKPI